MPQINRVSQYPKNAKRSHKALTIKEKVEILQKLENGKPVSKLHEEYGIGTTTIYDLKAQRNKILKFYVNGKGNEFMTQRKNVAEPKLKSVDQAVYEWFNKLRNDGVPVSGPLLCEKARELHKNMKISQHCDYSLGWLHKFKQRHGIHFRKTERKLQCMKRNSVKLMKYAREKVREMGKNQSCQLRKSRIENADVVNVAAPEIQDESNNSSEREEEQEVLEIERGIKLGEEYLKFLEKRDFISHQQIVNMYLIQEELQNERSKRMERLFLLEASRSIEKNILNEQASNCYNSKPKEPSLVYLDTDLVLKTENIEPSEDLNAVSQS